MKAAAWIDRVKVKRGWDSDYRAAAELGITRGAMSQIRTGDTETLREETAMRVAELLGVDAAGIVIDQLAEKSKNETLRTALHEAANQRLYIMLSQVTGALSKTAEALGPLFFPGLKPARRHVA